MPVCRDPSFEADAYRLWCLADKYDWKINTKDLAEKLDVPIGRVGYIISQKGWLGKIGNIKEAGSRIAEDRHRRGWNVDENTLDLTQLFRT